MLFVGIIPARYASTRFPGKPLVDLRGKPMIQRVYEQASMVLDHVFVATDDVRIYDCVQSFGGQAVMTSKDHKCGTDRVYEAYSKLRNEHWPNIDDSQLVVVNIQGDEPFIQPDQIRALMGCFPTEIATLVHPFSENDSWDDLQNPNFVKVAIAYRNSNHQPCVLGRAVYFSRSVIPYLRKEKREQWLQSGKYYRHIGMYAYRADILEKITSMAPSVLEQTECLEQLRWLEHGLTIHVGLSRHTSIGIDTPEDLQAAIQHLQSASL